MTEDKNQSTYQVLARKYRPQTFAQMIGQDALVRVMRNAFKAQRVAHAFILTGVRGVGKTTAARILAKCLNCTGVDGRGGQTSDPCDICENCTSIISGQHVDVLEMDAASRTGVADIRDIIESVAYQAVDARFKVYIIDEVHMLSNSAFNALLKTLEEPPQHAKFVFATTEVHQVPATILSRCQRFDLRRIQPKIMTKHISDIARREDAAISDEALALMVRAAEGSVRDALSLLDQAIAFCGGNIEASKLREMLALADKGRLIDLIELIMAGNVRGALEELDDQYREGADPLALLQDLANVVHLLSIAKVSPQSLADPTLTPDERLRCSKISKALGLQVLARSWQLLLKSIEEVAYAPSALMAAEMAIIRLTHVSSLPTPEELVRKFHPSQSGESVAEGQAAVAPVAERAVSETPEFQLPPREPPKEETEAIPPKPVDSMEIAKSHELGVAVLSEFPDAIARLRDDAG
ncbi:MAG: DNA polymerase III subunit gamma/tau [Rhodobacteraceae bacterium]|nr:DNA polymerase III subunit gamma/tau [Paracoccaceae bacterium]